MAWSLGANSNSPPFAPAIGANAISTMRAALLIGVLAAAGALTQGGAISETVGADLIDGVLISPLAATTGLLVAASFIIIAKLAIELGIPISFNNIIISGVIGGGLAAGSAGVSRRKIGVIIVFWLLTLGTSIGIGFGLYRLFSPVLGIQ